MFYLKCCQKKAEKEMLKLFLKISRNTSRFTFLYNPIQVKSFLNSWYTNTYFVQSSCINFMKKVKPSYIQYSSNITHTYFGISECHRGILSHKYQFIFSISIFYPIEKYKQFNYKLSIVYTNSNMLTPTFGFCRSP